MSVRVVIFVFSFKVSIYFSHGSSLVQFVVSVIARVSNTSTLFTSHVITNCIPK